MSRRSCLAHLLPVRNSTMHAHPADPEGFGDGGRSMPRRAYLTDLGDRDRGRTTFVDPLALAASMPACCRSRMNLRSISATIPSTVTQHGYEDRPPLDLACF